MDCALFSDSTQWVGVITGEGERAFCAGNDLKCQAASGEMSRIPANGVAGLTSRRGVHALRYVRPDYRN